jgi:hypothetical protein
MAGKHQKLDELRKESPVEPSDLDHGLACPLIWSFSLTEHCFLFCKVGMLTLHRLMGGLSELMYLKCLG